MKRVLLGSNFLCNAHIDKAWEVKVWTSLLFFTHKLRRGRKFTLKKKTNKNKTKPKKKTKKRKRKIKEERKKQNRPLFKNDKKKKIRTHLIHRK